MAVAWTVEDRTAFRRAAVSRLAVLNKAIAEGRSTAAVVVEFANPNQITSLVPEWPLGPIVLIGTDGEFNACQDLSEVPADWRVSIQVLAALDLFWWVQQKQPGKLHLTLLGRAVPGPSSGARTGWNALDHK